MNNQESNQIIKPLKDYPDAELIREVIQRIRHCSLETNQLIMLMLEVGVQHLGWYEKERQKSKEKQAAEKAQEKNHD